jgi:hypothetical protein
MKTLDLEKLWEVCNILSEKESEFAECNTYVHLLGSRSNFSAYSFEQFLNYYSFKIEEDVITVYNNDGVPYEDYTNNDYSYIPSVLLSFSRKELDEWIDDEVAKQLKQQEFNKIQEKENIKLQIENLQKRLNS